MLNAGIEQMNCPHDNNVGACVLLMMNYKLLRHEQDEISRNVRCMGLVSSSLQLLRKTLAPSILEPVLSGSADRKTWLIAETTL